MCNQKEEIVRYFNELDRGYFINEYKEYAQFDRPIPIGHGQTISQPTLVLNMTIQLNLQPNSKVLEIGTGSGYQTALLAPFCKEVYTVERLKPLHDQAKERLGKLGLSNIHYKLGDGSLGWPEHQPYDRIIVTASASQIPEELLNQLRPGGRMIIPVGDDYMQRLKMIDKDLQGEVTISVINEVAFVRLKGKYE